MSEQPIEQTNKQTSEQQPAKKKWTRTLLWIALGAVGLLIIAFIGLSLYFNDAYFQTRIQSAVKSELGRDLEIGSLHVSLWNGSVVLNGVRLLNADESFKDRDTLRVERVSAQVAVWPLAWSGGKKITGLTVVLEKPEFIVERHGDWPHETSNIDDLIQKLFSGPPGTWPKQTGLKALGLSLAVHGGSVTYVDSEEHIGTSNLKDLAIDVSQAELGQPAQVKAGFTLVTPHAPQGGTAALDGRIRWIEADGSINPAAFADIAFSGQLKDLDLARVARHLRQRVSLLGGEYHGALGQPLTGTLKLEAPTLAQAHLTTALETDGVMSIWHDHKRVAGNVPARTDVDLKGGWSGGAMQLGETRVAFVLAGSRAALSGPETGRLLDFKLVLSPEQADANYTCSLVAKLDELFATDVGVVLGLKGRLGGTLEMKMDSKRGADGKVTAEGKLSTREGYVVMGDTRQPTRLEAGFSAHVLPDAQGRPERADVTFTADADCFSVQTLRPVVLTSLNEPQKLAADAGLKLHVGGRELWKQFGPLLEVLDMKVPLEEALDGELTASGGGGKVEFKLEGTLQQQKAAPTPIRLVADARYDGGALVDVPTAPYLVFNAKVTTQDAKDLSIELTGTATRGKDRQVIALPKFSATGSVQALSALNARFGAYVQVFLGPQYTATGLITQKATSQLVQNLGPDGTVVGSELTMTTDVHLTDFQLHGPALFADAQPLNWTERDATVQLGLKLKEAGGTSTLSLSPAKLHGDGLELDGEVEDADVARLKAAGAEAAAPAKLWLEALPFTRISVQASAAIVKQAQALGILPAEPLAVGDLVAKASHDPKTRRLQIETLTFQNPMLSVKLAAPMELDTAALLPVAEAKSPSTAKLLSVLPSFAVEATAKTEGLQERFEKKLDPALFGDVFLRAGFDHASGQLNVEKLNFSCPALDGSLTASGLGIDKVGAFLDGATKDAAAAAQLLPDIQFELKGKGPLFQCLRTLELLPKELALAGTLGAKASYQQATDRLVLESLDFARDPQSSSPLYNVAATGEVAAVRTLIAKPPAEVGQLAPHLDKGFTIKSLVVGWAELNAFLKQKGIAAAFATDALAGVYAAKGPLALQDVTLRSANAPGVFNLSFNALTPLAWHPRSAPERAGAPSAPSPEAVAEFSGTWGFDAAAPLRVNLNAGALAAQGTLNLDAAGLRYVVDPKYFTYDKPAGTPCKLKLDASLGADNVAHVSVVELTGGPLNLALADFSYHTAAPKPVLSLGKLTVSNGALSATVSGVQLDQNKDYMHLQLNCESLDVAKLAALGAQLPPHFQVGGALNNVQALYDGPASAFPKTLTASTTVDLRLAGTEPGQEVSLTVAGNLSADQSSITAGDKGVIVTLAYPQAKVRNTQTLQVPLQVTGRNQGVGVLEALQKPGLPILVKVQTAQAQELDVSVLSNGLSALANAASPGPSTSSGPSDMSAIAEMRAELAASAQKVWVSDSVQLLNAQLPSVIFDRLVLTVSDAKTDLNIPPADGKKENYQVQSPLGLALVLAREREAGRLVKDELRNWNGNILAQVNGLVAHKEVKETIQDTGKKLGLGLAGGLLGGKTGRSLQLYGSDFGLFLNTLAFSPCEIPIRLTSGKATIAHTLLTGTGKNADLQVAFEGSVDVVKSSFAPQFTLWLTKLPVKTQQALRIDKLTEADRTTILTEFEQCKFTPVTAKGDLGNPDFNETAVLSAFNDLDDRITKMLSQTEGGTSKDGTTPPPEEKKKKGFLEGLGL